MSHDKSHSECCNAKVLMGGICMKCKNICVEVFDSPSHDKEWEKEFDTEYGTTDIDIMSVGIVAETLTHTRTKPNGSDASYITKKLRNIIQSLVTSHDEALVGKLEAAKNVRYTFMDTVGRGPEDYIKGIDAAIKLIKEQ